MGSAGLRRFLAGFSGGMAGLGRVLVGWLQKFNYSILNRLWVGEGWKRSLVSGNGHESIRRSGWRVSMAVAALDAEFGRKSFR